LNRSPVVPYIREAELDLYFSTLDDDQSRTIEINEFYDLCDILQFSFKRFPISGCTTRLPICQNLEAFVRSEEMLGLDNIVVLILTINSFLVLIQSLRDLADQNDTNEDNIWSGVNFFFSIVYILELCLRLCVVPFIEYWSQASNQFDFFATITLFVAGLCWAIPQIYVPQDMLRFFLLLQMLRLLRLLNRVPQLTFIISCIVRMVRASQEAIGLLFGALFLYSFLGVLLFGGLIYDANEALDGTEYRKSNFEVLNFNDMALGMFLRCWHSRDLQHICVVHHRCFLGAVRFEGKVYFTARNKLNRGCSRI